MSIRAEMHRQLANFADELFLLDELERDQARILAGYSLQPPAVEPQREPVTGPTVLGTPSRRARLWTFARSDRGIETVAIVGMFAPALVSALAGQTELAIAEGQWAAAMGCAVAAAWTARG